ncbi:Single-stranded DNA-binding protein 3 [Triplophysa tibetana]|uniref:Single-stranded DNA-binding protein 3 n=1 Tax=Triplophysa tibetana TaxID=1572043 RepID=A0A5A9NWR1_9TELE|nr:Single-stranded DNA-binding protein 3 [Triplophysa tibetana]
MRSDALPLAAFPVNQPYRFPLQWSRLVEKAPVCLVCAVEPGSVTDELSKIEENGTRVTLPCTKNMFPKGKSSVVPSDGQAREKLALYVYEYLLHIGAQKSAQTFLSEIRWEKNITLGDPPGFLHSWWCVFWDLYCAAPERRDTCEHSSEAKAFHDYSAAAAPSPVLGNMPPGDGMPGGPMPPGFFQGPPGSQASPHAPPPPNSMMGPHGQPFMSPRFGGGPRPPIRMGNQPPGGVPTAQPMLPNMEPRLQGPMQRMNVPRGMGPMGPQGPQGGGPPGTPGIVPSPADSNNSSENLYTMINSTGGRNSFPIGPGSEGPLGAMAGMDPMHMNGGSGDLDGLPKNSPNNMSGMSNPPGTPRDEDVGGSYLHSFQNENQYSPSMTMSV